MKTWRLVKRDNYIYIGSTQLTEYDPEPLYIYQVDVGDVHNPLLIKKLEFNNLYINILPVFINDYFIAKALWGSDNIYTIPDLEYYGTLQEQDMWLKTLNDTVCLDLTAESSIFKLYNVSDINNFQYITTVDLSEFRGVYEPRQFMTLNDTTIAISGQTAISFWNISNIAEWQYLSHYQPSTILQYETNFTISEDNAVLMHLDDLELLDISNIYNPQSISFCDLESIYQYNITNYGEYIYIATYSNGIEIYHIENNDIQFVDNYYEYPSFNYSTHLYDNHLFVEIYGDYGIYVFNVCDPHNPSEIITCLKDAPLRSPVGHDSLLAMHDYDDCTIKLYDISDPEDPVLRNIIDDLLLLDWAYGVVSFNDSEPEVMYLHDSYDGDIRKYDISQPGNCPLLFNYNITNNQTDFIPINGYGYLYTRSTHPQKLFIIDGLYNNDPELMNTINNFSNYQHSAHFRKCGGFICLNYTGWTDLEETRLFNLDDPLNPNFYRILNIPSTNSWPRIHNDLLFTKTHNVSFVFDLNESTSDTLHYIDYFNGLFLMYGYDFYDVDEKQYLFVTEPSSIGLYEYSYNVGVDEEPELHDNIITSYPNPFANSTTLQYNKTSNEHEKYIIKVYNVKGQLVRELNVGNVFGMNEVNWDGKDENGNDVKSGVYFYKLSGDDEHIGKVVKLQ